jgi:hypothetical protein
MALVAVGVVVVLESAGEEGKREGRLRVRERRRSWFGSRVWVRIWGPSDWKRLRKEVAIVDAEMDEDEEKRRLRRCLVRGREGRVAVVKSIVALSGEVDAISTVQLRKAKIEN